MQPTPVLIQNFMSQLSFVFSDNVYQTKNCPCNASLFYLQWLQKCLIDMKAAQLLGLMFCSPFPCWLFVFQNAAVVVTFSQNTKCVRLSVTAGSWPQHITQQAFVPFAFICLYFCVFGDFYTSCHCGFLFKRVYSVHVQLSYSVLHYMFNLFYVTDEVMLMLVLMHSYLICIYNEIFCFCLIYLKRLFFFVSVACYFCPSCVCVNFLSHLLETKDFRTIFKFQQTDGSHCFGCILL